MYSEVFGYRINLIYCAICVAIWDIYHIIFEFHERYIRLQLYESVDEYGCLNDFSKPHCAAILVELSIYSLDLVFCIFLIFGAAAMKKVWVLGWILLSLYHLIDFLLYFTPIYGEPMSLSVLSLASWADLGISVLGLAFVIYFFRKLVENQNNVVASERLANVEDFNGVDFGAY